MRVMCRLQGTCHNPKEQLRQSSVRLLLVSPFELTRANQRSLPVSPRDSGWAALGK